MTAHRVLAFLLTPEIQFALCVLAVPLGLWLGAKTDEWQQRRRNRRRRIYWPSPADVVRFKDEYGSTDDDLGAPVAIIRNGVVVARGVITAPHTITLDLPTVLG